MLPENINQYLDKLKRLDLSEEGSDKDLYMIIIDICHEQDKATRKQCAELVANVPASVTNEEGSLVDPYAAAMACMKGVIG